MKRLSVVLIAIMFCLSSTGYAQASDDSKASAKIKANVKRYWENNKKVVVVTNFGTRIKGQIVRAGDNEFTIKEAKAGNEYEYQYDKVEKVAKSGGLSTTTIITLAAVGAGAAILLGVIGKRCRNEGGCL